MKRYTEVDWTGRLSKPVRGVDDNYKKAYHGDKALFKQLLNAFRNTKLPREKRKAEIKKIIAELDSIGFKHEVNIFLKDMQSGKIR